MMHLDNFFQELSLFSMISVMFIVVLQFMKNKSKVLNSNSLILKTQKMLERGVNT